MQYTLFNWQVQKCAFLLGFICRTRVLACSRRGLFNFRLLFAPANCLANYRFLGRLFKFVMVYIKKRVVFLWTWYPRDAILAWNEQNSAAWAIVYRLNFYVLYQIVFNKKWFQKSFSNAMSLHWIRNPN